MSLPDDTVRHEIDDGELYVVGDAVNVLEEYREKAAAVFLDDAWARPGRVQQEGLAYDLHPFDGDGTATTTDVIDASREALVEGGWLVADADDWLFPRFAEYVRTRWGDAAANPDGGGFRKLGGVTYVTADGRPDRETHGDRLTTGGYSVLFAHQGPTERRTTVSARQVATWPERTYRRGGRAKPIAPYEAWIDGLVDEGELILVPCAGTAPAAIAARHVFGDAARYVCVDVHETAYEGFQERYAEEFGP